MKKFTLMLGLLVLALGFVVTDARAQGGAAGRGPDPSTVRDPDLEKDSMKSLEAVRLYFRLRKAYVAALDRCEEIIAGNPTFSRIDEVLYYAGASSLNLAERKGKQAPKKEISADKYRDYAREYLSRVVNDFPDSEFRELAQKELTRIGEPKQTTTTTKQ
ncbi:MAG TPA: outer membrane protein assembly factor BamD [Pyrinomonadaceae bacterium]|nr:outer membrane protein assembly factor BamD [Pyrinomonadaceae bacterium]